MVVIMKRNQWLWHWLNPWCILFSFYFWESWAIKLFTVEYNALLLSSNCLLSERFLVGLWYINLRCILCGMFASADRCCSTSYPPPFIKIRIVSYRISTISTSNGIVYQDIYNQTLIVGDSEVQTNMLEHCILNHQLTSLSRQFTNTWPNKVFKSLNYTIKLSLILCLLTFPPQSRASLWTLNPSWVPRWRMNAQSWHVMWPTLPTCPWEANSVSTGSTPIFLVLLFLPKPLMWFFYRILNWDLSNRLQVLATNRRPHIPLAPWTAKATCCQEPCILTGWRVVWCLWPEWSPTRSNWISYAHR